MKEELTNNNTIKHIMNLKDRPFLAIKNETKTIELRLYDEKRRKINAGDIIEFNNNKTDELILVEVVKLHKFKTFNELYDVFDKVSIGYEKDEIASPDDMSKYYSEADIRNFGVVGIEIRKI